MGIGWDGSDGATDVAWSERARSKLAHLTPRLVHSIAQPLDLLQVRDIRRERDDIGVADNAPYFLRSRAQRLLVGVRQSDLQSNPR